MTSNVVFALLAVVSVAGALAAVASRDMMRSLAGLGALLLGVAGLFALFGAGLLALAEVFLYVGGVLVLVLFAMMLTHRSELGYPDLESRPSIPAFLAPIAIAIALVAVFSPAARSTVFATAISGPDSVAAEMLGAYLPQFEIAGLALLVALVAVVALMGGERR